MSLAVSLLPRAAVQERRYYTDFDGGFHTGNTQEAIISFSDRAKAALNLQIVWIRLDPLRIANGFFDPFWRKLPLCHHV
jgi:hypothetical protein